MIGTRGVPATYGGFETAVEEVGSRLAAHGHEVLVFGRHSSRETYNGMTLVGTRSLNRRAFETISRTAVASLHPAARKVDVCFLFNVANSPFLPILRMRGMRVAVHVDGLEWNREKWGLIASTYFRAQEQMASRFADAIVADAGAIASYYVDRYGCLAHQISYGAKLVDECDADLLESVHLRPGEYHLVVARLEPENNVHLVIQAYRQSPLNLPLVIVGDTRYGTAYRSNVKGLAAETLGVRMLGSVWDQPLLDALYAGARTYIHGHSVGGTNPSLLRALGARAPVAAFDVIFNREVASTCAEFWSDVQDLASILERSERDPGPFMRRAEVGYEHVAMSYRWDDVALSYERLAAQLIGVATDPSAR